MIPSLSIPLLSVQLFPYNFEMIIFQKNRNRKSITMSSEFRIESEFKISFCLSYAFDSQTTASV